MSGDEWNRNVSEAIAAGELRDATERAEAAEERADALEAEVERLGALLAGIRDAAEGEWVWGDGKPLVAFIHILLRNAEPETTETRS